jgi:hypothetical protein
MIDAFRFCLVDARHPGLNGVAAFVQVEGGYGNLDQTGDFAIQILIQERHLVGSTRVEFLKAVVDAARNRLSIIEEVRELEANPAARPVPDLIADILGRRMPVPQRFRDVGLEVMVCRRSENC